MTEIEDKIDSNYDMFRINIKESYRVLLYLNQILDRTYNLNLKKFRNKSLQLKKLELELESKLQVMCNKDFKLVLKSLK